MTKSPEDESLLPCPFCENNEPHIQNGRVLENIGQYLLVWCHVCGASSREELRETDAIAAWNRRSTQPDREAIIEECAKVADAEWFSGDRHRYASALGPAIVARIRSLKHSGK